MSWRVTGAAALAMLALLQGSCSSTRRMGSNCHEPAVPAALENPPLRVPAGLDMPDTRNAVKIPELKEPEKPRGKTDPCLSQPPAYGS